MKRDSIQAAAVGMVIGILTLSAAALANRGSGGGSASPPEPAAEVSLEQAAFSTEDPWSGSEADVFAPAEYRAALRVEAAPDQPLYLCDLSGNVLAPAEPDADGEVTLGPIPPGRYVLAAGEERLGSFRLLDGAVLGEAGGRLWTDGETLHLTDYLPGQAEVSVTLPRAGLYRFRLVDDLGVSREADLFVPSNARPDRGRVWIRTLEFYGLPEGRYTLVCRDSPLLQFQVLAGGVARVSAEAA